MIARDLMPWLFVGRKTEWTPFAKIRCEGGRCSWTGGERGKKERPGLSARPPMRRPARS